MQIEGAQLLGINLEPLGFDHDDIRLRKKRLDPDELISSFTTLLTSRRERNDFERVLQQTGTASFTKEQLRLDRTR